MGTLVRIERGEERRDGERQPAQALVAAMAVVAVVVVRGGCGSGVLVGDEA